jgi:DNA polymerase III epsilon subunit-like protein
LQPQTVFSSLINPGIDLKKYSASKASKVNGITGDMVKNAPTLIQAWPKIQPYLNHHWVTFNSQFDIPLLLRDARRYNLSIKPIQATCAMKIASAYLNSPDWLNVDEVIKELHMRLPKGIRHTAEYDAMVAARILAKIYRSGI